MNDNKTGIPENLDANSKLVFIIDVIKRYDNYIMSTNAKASLIIAFNSLILGTVLLKFGDIISFYNSPGFRILVGFLLVLISISSLFSLFFVFRVVYPYFGSKIDDDNQKSSLVYFGSVSKISGKEYLDHLEICSIQELIKDLAIQATIIARGLNSKMLMMRHSIRAITFSLVFILVLVILRTTTIFC